MTGDPRAFRPHWQLTTAPASLGTAFTCVRMRCTGVRAWQCIQRQRLAEAQTTRDTERGQAPDNPECLACPQGQDIRDRLDPEHHEFEGGVGPHGLRPRPRTLRDDAPPAPAPAEGLPQPTAPALDTPAPAVPTAPREPRRRRKPATPLAPEAQRRKRRRRKARVSGRGR